MPRIKATLTILQKTILYITYYYITNHIIFYITKCENYNILFFRKCNLVQITMPPCVGRPGKSCPFQRKDSSVIWTIADLTLGPNCENVRFLQSVSANMSDSDKTSAKQVIPAIAVASPATVNAVADPNDERFARCELLYFVQNKCGILTFDKLVSICTNVYRCKEVETARILLAKYKRLTKHIGGTDDERRERTVIDIVKLCLAPKAGLPVYYSVEKSRIPPVGVEHVDVSGCALLQEVSALREKVRSFAAIRSDIAAMRQTLSAVPTIMPPSPRSEVAPAQQDIPAATCEMTAVINTTTSAAVAVTDNESSSSNRPLFAALASALKDGDMAVKSSRPRPQSHSHRPVVERSTTGSRLKPINTKRSIDIFVSRLSPLTAASDVKLELNDILGGDFTDSLLSVHSLNRNLKICIPHFMSQSRLMYAT